LAAIITLCRGNLSPATPPTSRNAIIGTRAAVATQPTSLAVPPIASTANGIATVATALPEPLMTSHARSSRKFRLCIAPRGHLTIAIIGHFAHSLRCLLCRRNFSQDHRRDVGAGCCSCDSQAPTMSSAGGRGGAAAAARTGRGPGAGSGVEPGG